VGDVLTVLEPATEAVLAEIPRAGVEEVDTAVAGGRAGGRPRLRGAARVARACPR
jgi:acyl-CoA reductase-like NAD-dependent aldehyde dehydrogenase